MLTHLKTHSWQSGDLVKLIGWMHDITEPPKREYYSPWDKQQGKPPPTWWTESAKLRAEGWTLQEIGAKYQVTRERVRQVLNLQRKLETE